MHEEKHRRQLLDKIEALPAGDFREIALEVFRYQATHNRVYADYLRYLNVDPAAPKELSDIPFLPIQLFKSFALQSGAWDAVRTFTSSGTTGRQTSRHLLREDDWYRRNARRGFEYFYGALEDYCVLALLPAYLERTGSSLVFMADDFIQRSRYPESGFFLKDYDALVRQLRHCREKGIPVLLIGVSFALWDLAEQYPMDLSGTIIMETGGMKGRRREITREELHGIFKTAFRVEAVHSEYGMTELLSQAYSLGGGLFHPTPTMRVMTREITDPLAPQDLGKTGAVNIIDLANLDTISFIATDDLGRVYKDGSFEILGRLDASDLRGCNLLLADV
ncbi:long-chain-fatty-acid--protein ligase [Flavilitoribacter nigricans]|uniref:Acyl transferase n=1 Tax=Flavilitoribacter nigricans (strain ATCC 23147 / DSM 23189 / NBRC 102662 / NCIMB 1420 / SS-2) TaxID=1122177 RepID=A0A2D0NCD9_FLAN2|nr:acyl transferase [Flavilitoribacter nigricans]PHN05849.1 acyl transferase [Flavilitoribacter nigricans DSM 23189 = NBRC 102662]